MTLSVKLVLSNYMYTFTYFISEYANTPYISLTLVLKWQMGEKIPKTPMLISQLKLTLAAS